MLKAVMLFLKLLSKVQLSHPYFSTEKNIQFSSHFLVVKPTFFLISLFNFQNVVFATAVLNLLLRKFMRGESASFTIKSDRR